MTAEDWTLSEAEQARKETADAAGLTVEEVASRRALPCPNGTTRAGPVRGRASSTRPWGRAMTDARRPQMEVLPVARVADGDDPEHELRAELRMARELLAVREARSGQGQPPAPPANKITHPRLTRLGDAQLRDHIARLERDLADAQHGFENEEYSQLNGRLDYQSEEER